MKKKHEKSSCCRGQVRRFGGRRRQCVMCKKTWRVWKTRRGRKKLRVSVEIAHRFVMHRLLPVRSPQAGPMLSRNERAYRLGQSRTRCASLCPWPIVPEGNLIAVADALVKYVEGTWHTWYFVLVRALEETEATVLPPFHRIGTETSTGWCEAFDALNAPIRNRIKALVCDGHTGLVYEARWRGWLLERCHFHLIARIQSRRSKWKTSQHYEEGRHLYCLVKRVLSESNERQLQEVVNELEEIGWETPSKDLKNTLKGFVNHYQEFRTYLYHPQLRLPITNNTAETFIGLVEEVGSRARGFKNVSVLNEWITCVCKTRKKIRCAPPEEKKKYINRYNQT